MLTGGGDPPDFRGSRSVGEDAGNFFLRVRPNCQVQFRGFDRPASSKTPTGVVVVRTVLALRGYVHRVYSATCFGHNEMEW